MFLDLLQKNQDLRIKNFLSETYPKGIPSKVLRNAREFGVYIDGELFNLRTGIDSKYTFDGIDVKLSGVTKYVETLDSNKIRSDIKIKYPSWARFERKKGSGLFLKCSSLAAFAIKSKLKISKKVASIERKFAYHQITRTFWKFF